MSRQLERREGAKVSLQERLRQQLQGQLGAQGGGLGAESALLLDISGSMRDSIGPNQTKYDELCKLAADFTDVRRFEFNHHCREISPKDAIGYACGGTNLGGAFFTMKTAQVKHVVLITDGKPDSEQTALEHAKGLRIDIFYVGPDPAPEFLRILAQKSGGTYGKATLEARTALTGAVRKLLSAPKGAVES